MSTLVDLNWNLKTFHEKIKSKTVQNTDYSGNEVFKENGQTQIVHQKDR